MVTPLKPWENETQGPWGVRIINVLTNFSAIYNNTFFRPDKSVVKGISREQKIKWFDDIKIEWSSGDKSLDDPCSFWDLFSPNWEYFYDTPRVIPFEHLQEKTIDNIYDVYVKKYSSGDYDWIKHILNPSEKLKSYIDKLGELSTDFDNDVACYYRGWHDRGVPICGGIHPSIYGQFVDKMTKDGLVLLCTDNGYWESEFSSKFHKDRFRSVSKELVNNPSRALYDTSIQRPIYFPSENISRGIFADFFNSTYDDGDMIWVAKIMYLSKFKNLITNAHTQTTIQFLAFRENLDNLVVIDSYLNHKWFHTLNDIDTSDMEDTFNWGTF